MFRRMDSPPKKIRCLLMLGLKVRDFLVALRSQRPPWVWRMCRPNIVVFAQTSQAPLAMRQCPFRGRIRTSMLAPGFSNGQTVAGRARH